MPINTKHNKNSLHRCRVFYTNISISICFLLEDESFTLISYNNPIDAVNTKINKTIPPIISENIPMMRCISTRVYMFFCDYHFWLLHFHIFYKQLKPVGTIILL